ncbi:unnamed protein product [Owenia fusiformis]|uniref:Leucine-rich repeat-containing protein 42 n=1 Tax=Owenia fusiformis TaxID=6347 RepID=A0A8S4N4Z7_OWEFU|nr:unnamed protein product [Owenia fusiformis]
MAFEDFPRGIFEQLSEPGPIHILEHGRLRSTPGYEQRSPKRKKQCVIDLSWQRGLVPNKEDSKELTDPDKKETKSVQNVPLLKKLCVYFVAHHIHLVESLIDFPDIIGKEIFETLCDIGSFKERALRSENTITLFSEAYQNELLSSLCLRKSNLFLEKMPNIVPLFPYIEELDIGWCKLRDDSEILQHIGQLMHLRKLSLQGNLLSSRGIQKLTAPYRMFETGWRQLAYLDVSCNRRISGDVEKYLKWLNLESLNLSGTLINVKSIKELEISLNMTHIDFEEFHHYDIINSGWAASVIGQWIKDCLTEDRAAKEPVRKSGLTNFYAKRKPPVADDTIELSADSAFPRIHLMRLDMDRNIHNKQHYEARKTSQSDHKTLSLDDIVENVTKEHKPGEAEIDLNSDEENLILKPRCNSSHRASQAGCAQTKSPCHTDPVQPTLKELHLERQSRHQNKNTQKYSERNTRTKQDQVVAAGFDIEDWDVLSGYL